MKNYVQRGLTLTFTASAALTSGQGVMLSATLFGVACADVASGAEGEAQIAGVFELPKTSANTPSAFAPAYWDDAAGVVTTTATDNALIGVFAKAYGAGTTAAEVLLIPQAG